MAEKMYNPSLTAPITVTVTIELETVHHPKDAFELIYSALAAAKEGSVFSFVSDGMRFEVTASFIEE